MATNPSERFRKLAENLTAQIDDKRRAMTQNPTPKRMKEYRSRLHDANNLERVQKALLALAEAHDAGTVPDSLAKLRSKDEIHALVYKGLDGSRGGYYDVIESPHYGNTTEPARLLQGMIDKTESPEDRAEKDRIAKIARMEADVQFRKLPGFFPTPGALVERMIEEAGITEGHSVLEPEAGKGDIAEAARAAGATVDVCEVAYSLQEILKLKGFNVIGSDFLELEPNGANYDRILMNPPFEKGADAEHIQHAYKFLREGGRLVAIASEGSFFRSDRKATGFREWLDVNGTSEKLGGDTFSGPGTFRSTGVNCRLVIVDKPVAEVPESIPLSAVPEAEQMTLFA